VRLLEEDEVPAGATVIRPTISGKRTPPRDLAPEPVPSRHLKARGNSVGAGAASRARWPPCCGCARCRTGCSYLQAVRAGRMPRPPARALGGYRAAPRPRRGRGLAPGPVRQAPRGPVRTRLRPGLARASMTTSACVASWRIAVSNQSATTSNTLPDQAARRVESWRGDQDRL
jgi:hypothetical protein